ncbi:MAG: TlpA family protein disulfide reductase [Lachnospiraceae bacterium]|nr:TlpA family protein disulfide reductase [Lachnospiraceae bacterium]
MKKAYRKICFTGIVLAVLLAGCGGENGTDAADRGGDSSAQETAELLTEEDGSETSRIVFECQDMEGNTVSASVFTQSKLTMVNVWATYCNPCLSEMPGLGELAGEYEPDEFQIIGIISDVQEGGDAAALDNAAALIEQTGADYTHLLLNESVYYALLTDVAAVPTTFFVDENGVVVDTVIGAMEKSAWEEKINALLEES